MKDDLWTIGRILLRLKAEHGISVTKRTFQYYQALGLLPKRPARKTHGPGGRGVFNYYNGSTLCELRSICELKGYGYTLAQIKNLQGGVK